MISETLLNIEIKRQDFLIACRGSQTFSSGLFTFLKSMEALKELLFM